jgi:tetratricopeptide (TPR) repeat protein
MNNQTVEDPLMNPPKPMFTSAPITSTIQNVPQPIPSPMATSANTTTTLTRTTSSSSDPLTAPTLSTAHSQPSFSQGQPTDLRVDTQTLTGRRQPDNDPLSRSPLDPLSRSTTSTSQSSNNPYMGNQTPPTSITQTAIYGQPNEKREVYHSGIKGFFGTAGYPPEKKLINYAEVPEGLSGILYLIERDSLMQALEFLNNTSKKYAISTEEKIYVRVLKTYLLMKLRMYDKIALEFSLIGNMDKIIEEKLTEPSLPYNLRLLHALNAYTLKPTEDKCIERLFSICAYCEHFLKNFKFKDDDLYDQEVFDVKKMCDIEVSESLWASRLFKTALIIIEILIERNEIKTATEIIDKYMLKFPNNQILISLLAKTKLKKGEFSNARALFEQVININVTKEIHSEINQFNLTFQFGHEKRNNEGKEKLQEFSSKYPQYGNLAANNIAYLMIGEGQIKEAIELLENTIRHDPHGINEAVVYNLLSLYDFYFDDAKDKKRLLEEVIDKFGRDHFNKAHLGSLLKK